MKHPHKEYETSKLWIFVKSSIEDLVENNDIELFTPIEYVVGYICKIYLQMISLVEKIRPNSYPL